MIVQHFDPEKLSAIPKNVYDLSHRLNAMNITIVSDASSNQKIEDIKLSSNLCLIRLPSSNPFGFIRKATIGLLPLIFIILAKITLPMRLPWKTTRPSRDFVNMFQTWLCRCI
jgi:hypothetical protein